MKRTEELLNTVAGALESKVKFCLEQEKNEREMIRIYNEYAHGQKSHPFVEEVKRHEIRAEVYRDIADVLKRSADIWRA